MFEVRFRSQVNPFAPAVLQEFHCPGVRIN
jgi:hypothetical protein